MKSYLKKFLVKYFPLFFSTLQSIRSRQLIERSCASDGRHLLANSIALIADNKVQGGIFSGMVLNPSFFPQHTSPKILGTYEDEVEPFLSDVAKMKIDKVINIGCAEGYYAVGSALLWPRAKVFAFDLDPAARAATEKHARVNNVHMRVTIQARATRENIRKALGGCGASLLIVDCEGAEIDLILPDKIPELKRASMLIELHPNFVNDIERILADRLKATHNLKLFYPENKNFSRYYNRHWVHKFSEVDLNRAVNEYRGFTPWLTANPLIPG